MAEWTDSRPVTYATAGIFQMCNGFTKLSLLTFYLQLSPQRGWKIAIWTSIAIVGIASTVITLMTYFYCTPVYKAYMPQVDGDCLNPARLYMATASLNIVTDVMLFVLPIPMVLHLRMGKAQKVGAVVIFGIGSVTVATSGVRLFYLIKVLNTKDLSWDAAQANVWSYVLPCPPTPYHVEGKANKAQPHRSQPLHHLRLPAHSPQVLQALRPPSHGLLGCHHERPLPLRRLRRRPLGNHWRYRRCQGEQEDQESVHGDERPGTSYAKRRYGRRRQRQGASGQRKRKGDSADQDGGDLLRTGIINIELGYE